MPPSARRSLRHDTPSPALSHSRGSDSEDFQDEPPVKKRKTLASKAKKKNTTKSAPSLSSKWHFSASLFSSSPSQSPPKDHAKPCSLPSRKHGLVYHRPLLLDGSRGQQGRESLLRWFDSVSHTRKMPWRKEWIDPSTVADKAILRDTLEERAYQVWISEIMLQQTRVATVIDYWNRWMARWPTIHRLAQASEDDVRSVWQGLGYYSRGTRILEAAKQVTADGAMNGLLPDEVNVLVDKIPGVGRYTAGAICAIVFGKAVPMVDGNVLRVLSRQLGIFGDVQKSKVVIDVLWGAADVLVKAAAQDDSATPRGEGSDQTDVDLDLSNVPGRWGQALMELGSTVCTPVPSCGDCPISSTCRAYAEGKAVNAEEPNTSSGCGDIEDVCPICEPFEDIVGEVDAATEVDDTTAKENKPPGATKSKKQQATLAAFAFTHQTRRKAKASPEPQQDEKKSLKRIVQHAKRFPLRTLKKPVREEETLVCAIRRPDGRYLISQRPEKGLLAGLWELPSKILEDPQELDKGARSLLARKFVSEITNGAELKCDGELGSVPWLFSHIKLTMHVYAFRLEGHVGADVGLDTERRVWSDKDEVEDTSMGTGMRKCWDLAKVFS